MALTFDDVTAITNAYYSKLFPQLVFNENIVMSRLWKKGSKVDGGERIKCPVKYQYGKSGAYSPYEVFDTSGEKNITSAWFEYKGYHGDLTVEGFEMMKNDSPLGIKKILDARMELAKDGCADSMATDSWSLTATDSSKTLTSLAVMCDDASGTITGVTTYGGIDRTTNSWWAGNVINASGATLPGASQGLTRAVSTAMFTIGDGSKVPTLIVSHPTILDKYMHEGIISQRLYDSEMLKRGWLVTKFCGVDWAADKHLVAYSATATANKIWFLNENYIDFTSHKDRNFKFKPLAQPVDQDVAIGRFLWAGNITCSAPKHSGVYYNFLWAYS